MVREETLRNLWMMLDDEIVLEGFVMSGEGR